jgi:type IV pilus assembly protein PilA
MKTNRSNKGFTLVEIMIVTIIIGLLAMMALPMWMKIRAAAQEKTIINNLRQLSSAAQQYFLENGVSTAAWADLVGTEKNIKTIATVAKENYPLIYNQTDTLIIATGSAVPGKPDISFAN